GHRGAALPPLPGARRPLRQHGADDPHRLDRLLPADRGRRREGRRRDRLQQARRPERARHPPRLRDREGRHRALLPHQGRRERRPRRLARARRRQGVGRGVPRPGRRLRPLRPAVDARTAAAAHHPGRAARAHHALRDLARPERTRRGAGVSRRALRRAGGLCVVSIGLSLALGYLHAGGAFGLFAGETTNKDATFSAGWVAAATGLGTPSPSGYDVSLAWTPGNHGVTGQELWGADGGTGAASSCGTYAQLATLPSASTASYLDSNRGSTLNGHWYCYRLVSTHGSWTAQATFPAQRIGLAATGL